MYTRSMPHPDPLGDGPELPAVSPARLLANDGYTLAEIAETLTLTEPEALAQLMADGNGFVTDAHVTRAEAALVGAAAQGDVKAADRLLAAHRPDRYGDKPLVDARTYVLNAGAPMDTATWLASVAARRVSGALGDPPAVISAPGGSAPEPSAVPMLPLHTAKSDPPRGF